jgi:hypothetical protein
MRITLMIEGMTERVFLPYLRAFLQPRLPGKMPKLDALPYDGRIPKGDKLKAAVRRLLRDPKRPADAVIALTDVYTGTADFVDAADAKAKMRQWVGPEPRFHPHAAQHDFEAWLLPYWDVIKQLSGTNRPPIQGRPEQIDHNQPPAHRLKEIFRLGRKGRHNYVKTRDAARILRDQDLMVSIQACPELKAMVNTILSLCDGGEIA